MLINARKFITSEFLTNDVVRKEFILVCLEDSDFDSREQECAFLRSILVDLVESYG
jgi:hypothetical protein